MDNKKIALVTGANKGIGREVVRQLSETGLRVYLGARNEALGKQAAAKLCECGGDVRLVQLDVTQTDSIQASAKTISEDSGKLDILINNAGAVFERAAPSQSDPALLRKTFETNYFGAIATTQTMLPLLRNSDFRVIVNVSARELCKGRLLLLLNTPLLEKMDPQGDSSLPEASYLGKFLNAK